MLSTDSGETFYNYILYKIPPSPPGPPDWIKVITCILKINYLFHYKQCFFACHIQYIETMILSNHNDSELAYKLMDMEYFLPYVQFADLNN